MRTSCCLPAPILNAGISAKLATAGAMSSTASRKLNHRVILIQHKCIEPLGESKSDYQIFVELSKRLGL